MGRESWHVERTGRSPWGALALVVLICLALVKDGADFSLGPPQLVTTTSVAFTGAAAPCSDSRRPTECSAPDGGTAAGATDGSSRDLAATRAGAGSGSG